MKYASIPSITYIQTLSTRFKATYFSNSRTPALITVPVIASLFQLYLADARFGN